MPLWGWTLFHCFRWNAYQHLQVTGNTVNLIDPLNPFWKGRAGIFQFLNSLGFNSLLSLIEILHINTIMYPALHDTMWKHFIGRKSQDFRNIREFYKFWVSLTLWTVEFGGHYFRSFWGSSTPYDTREPSAGELFHILKTSLIFFFSGFSVLIAQVKEKSLENKSSAIPNASVSL